MQFGTWRVECLLLQWRVRGRQSFLTVGTSHQSGIEMSEATDPKVRPAAGQRRVSPIINSPYEIPQLHLKLRGKQSADSLYDVADGRRAPGAVHEDDGASPSKGPAAEPYRMIGRIRQLVNDWRDGGYQGVDANTARLLDHWREVKDRKGLFFCQREAIETLIWLHTFKGRDEGCDGIHEEIDGWNGMFNDGLPRLSTKMATGTGKTVVIAMLMLWMAMRSKDPVSNFLIITPGITVTERLGDLTRPNGRDVFWEHELVPGGMRKPPMNIAIHHRHLLEPRQGIANEVGGKALDKVSGGILDTHAADLAKRHGGEVESPDETYQAVMNRLCGRAPAGTPLAILNDEAHHCYASAKKDQDNRKWYDAIIRIRDESGFQIAAIHDFSATPIWIQQRPKDAPGEVFPWTVSDFPLIEAVESGLTKIPRIPTESDTEEQKKARNVFANVETKKLAGRIDSKVQAYLAMLVNHHLKRTRKDYENSGHNPILCVVANTISNAQAFYRTIAGHWDEDPSQRELGEWPEFSNVDEGEDGTIRIKEHPPTLLVHSEVDKGVGADAGDTGVVKSPDLLAFFGNEEDGRAKYKNLAVRIRKMFGSAGRKGEEGEHVRCIVSVSMLTEGWDCRTVTEIFGFRAFGSDLLIEQVTGRALRRTNYDLDDDTGLFPAQHANLIGLPFEWVPDDPNPSPEIVPVKPYECRVVEGREHLEIRMPRVERYEAVPEYIKRTFDAGSVMPHNIEVSGPPDAIEVSFEGGMKVVLNSKQHHMHRDRAIWKVAAKATAMLIRDEKEEDAIRERMPVMRDLVVAASEWWTHPESQARSKRIERVVGNEQVAEKCAEALLASCKKTKREGWLKAHLEENNEWSSSAKPKSFESRLKHRFPSVVDGEAEAITKQSQRNIAPCHSATEAHLAGIMDDCEAVDAWVRNEGLDFYIPYRGSNGYQQRFEPDFVVRSKKGNLLVVEYKGEWQGKSDVHERSKKEYAEQYWVPSVNALMPYKEAGTRWGFLWLDPTSDCRSDFERALARLNQ